MISIPHEIEDNKASDGKDFRRSLGPWSAGALVAGTIIGTGIFLFVSDVANALRSPWLILSAWCAGGIVAILGALCLAELASTYPKTGGIYVFLNRALGPFVGFEYSWAQFFIMRVGSYCIQALAFAEFTAAFLSLDAGLIRKPLAICVISVLCGINILGIQWGSRVQNALTLIKITCLILLILVGFAFGLGLLQARPVPTVSPIPLEGRSPILLFGLALIAVMWTFGGWDQSPYVAEEVINPQRNLPLSIIGGLLLCAVLYVLANTSYLSVLTPEEMAMSGGRTAPLVLERALGHWASKGLSLVLMISTLGAANALILTGARIAFASGRDNAFFSWFTRTHPRTKTPVRGLVFQAILGTVVILCLKNPFTLLLYTGFAYWGFTALVPVALILLRRKDPSISRPFRVPLYPVVPIVFCLASLGMILAVFRDDFEKIIRPSQWGSNPPNVLITFGIIGAGAVVFAIQRLVTRSDKK